MTALEFRLRRMAASLEAAALEALASKGLLRRAHKDLDRGLEIRVVQETETALHLRAGEFEITLPESGPAAAACSCPAPGVCQHILAALLFLKKSDGRELGGDLPEPGSVELESAARELMALTPEQMEAWAGKSDFKAGMKLAVHSAAEIGRERAVRIRFPIQNWEVHYVRGGGLDGMIVSGRKRNARQLAIAAVIAFQRAWGREWNIPANVATPGASEGSPRTRAEVLDSCRMLLDETLANGLSRLSTASRQRWATLAVSALGVNLPRLALLLRGIGDETALVLARDARSHPGRMLARMAQAHALCTALQNSGENPRPDLVGAHRTRYDEVGHLDLIGAAAWPWRTASGYEGLTVLFWDAAARQWNSWTDARPSHQLADFNPVARYSQPGPWEGAESPRQLARSSFRLMNARRNPARRLSASTRSRALVTGPAKLEEHGLVPVQDWARLSELANARIAVGLKETNPLDSIVALKPAAWGERGFDAVTQIFRWVIIDRQQHSIKMEIGFEDLTKPAIEFLEFAPPDSLENTFLIGRIQRAPKGLLLHPCSIHQPGGKAIHLGLDTLAPPCSMDPGVAESDMDENFPDEDDAEPANVFTPAMARLLDEVDDALLALAEAGLATWSPLRVEALRRIAARAGRLGLQALETGLSTVAAHAQPCPLLRCSYLTQLHRRAAMGS